MFLFSKDELENAERNQQMPCKCEYCQNKFFLTKKQISRNIKHGEARFCSRKCSSLSLMTKRLVTCKTCGKEFYKKPSDIKSTNNNNFCSHSCAAIYNNTHKTKGNRRSKLESWLEYQLTTLYPDIEILYNDKEAIKSELDIFIPSLKLAFELNGIFHYEPIYGENKLNNIMKNDENKFKLCHENGISLCIIDTSKQKYFKESTSHEYLKIITKIINSAIFPS